MVGMGETLAQEWLMCTEAGAYGSYDSSAQWPFTLCYDILLHLS